MSSTPSAGPSTGATSTTARLSLRTVGVALGFALVAGAIMFGAARLARFTPAVGLYHGIVWAAFFGVYLMLPGGFKAHFQVPDPKKDMGPADIAYFTLVTHSGVGYGDIYPLTTAGRLVVMAHLFCVILAVFNMVPVGENTVSFAAFDIDRFR